MKLILLALTCFFMTFAWMLYATDQAPPLPKERGRWLDGKPLQWNDLKGSVVLVNVWTFECWNSYRSLPWLVSVQKKFAALRMIGVHSPEFESEKDRNRMRQVMASYGVSFPQILDDDHAYWNALANRYWPAFYIVDREGRIRGKFVGETHEGDAQARAIENLIAQLIAE